MSNGRFMLSLFGFGKRVPGEQSAIFVGAWFTVNFRVPLAELGRIVPEAIELDEVRDTGLGVLSMCACDFWVSRLGWLPIPPVCNNDMLCRVSTKIWQARCHGFGY